MKKKNFNNTYLTIAISLFMLSAFVLGFNLLQETIFEDELLIYNDNFTFNDINFLAKSDFQYGDTSTPGCASNDDSNCWTVSTTNTITSNNILEVKTYGVTTDNGAGGGNEQYPTIRTLIKTSNLQLKPSTLQEISVNYNVVLESRCNLGNEAKNGFIQFYLVKNNSEDIRIHNIGESSTGNYELTSSGNSSFIDNFNNISYYIPEDEYEILIFSRAGPSNCPGDSGTYFNKNTLIINSIDIIGIGGTTDPGDTGDGDTGSGGNTGGSSGGGSNSGGGGSSDSGTNTNTNQSGPTIEKDPFPDETPSTLSTVVLTAGIILFVLSIILFIMSFVYRKKK